MAHALGLWRPSKAFLMGLLRLALGGRLAHASDQSVGNGLGLATDLWVS